MCPKEAFFKAGQPSKGWAKTWAGWDRRHASQSGGIKKRAPDEVRGGGGGTAGRDWAGQWFPWPARGANVGSKRVAGLSPLAM